jgi:oxygen-independent coproporphyrinogen III oxidase
MVGLGCGARSYTRSLHYANDYAVNQKEVRGILEQYIASDNATFDLANYGFELNLQEQQRRFLLISLLSEEGLDLEAYCDRFSTSAILDFPDLQALMDWGMVWQQGSRLLLTETGLERSDAIGPWLFSSLVQSLMEGYQVK